ncbi:enoyl-CoA hydratase/isomerase family protein [Pseudonocardia sp. GCM10023141]|uniref:enoyl-CoA hydratase/isomerase family protein n=1 Tax=Pseudonocardia sp. GCM10023141 TaxID=3252653 RepID=UPI00361E4F4A
MAKKVDWTLDGDVAVITIDNAPLNLLDIATIEDFGTAVTAVRESDARAVLLRATGRIFSGGADVGMFRGMTAREAASRFQVWLSYVHRLEMAPVPTIAAVHGLCLAGGLELALACDLILAAEGTKLGQTEASIGTTTLLGGAQRIAQRAGTSRARRICFTAAMFDAVEFERWGIVDSVVPAASLEAEAMTLARELAAGPTQAHATVKAMIRVAATSGVQAADDFLLAHALELFDSDDMIHGVDTLLEHGARDFRAHTAYVGR